MANISFNEFKKRLHLSGWEGKNEEIVHYETDSTHSHFEINGRIIPMGLCVHDQNTNIVYFADADGALIASNDYFHLNADEQHEYKLFTCVEIR